MRERFLSGQVHWKYQELNANQHLNEYPILYLDENGRLLHSCTHMLDKEHHYRFHARLLVWNTINIHLSKDYPIVLVEIDIIRRGVSEITTRK